MGSGGPPVALEVDRLTLSFPEREPPDSRGERPRTRRDDTPPPPLGRPRRPRGHRPRGRRGRRGGLAFTRPGDRGRCPRLSRGTPSGYGTAIHLRAERATRRRCLPPEDSSYTL